MDVGNMRLVEEPRKPMAMNPKKFALWLFLASVFMLFASMTSAYIVRRADGDWLNFELPNLFFWTSGIVIASSITIQLAYFSARKEMVQKVKFWIVVTAFLGIFFLIGQVYAWGQLVQANIHMVGNPSGSFVYVLSGLHGIHLVSAIFFLLILWRSASKQKTGSIDKIQLEMCVTYWHFLSGLWLYLFVFLSYYR